MTEAEARAAIERATAASTDPVLVDVDLDALVRLARVGLAWRSGAEYGLGIVVVPPVPNAHRYVVTVAGIAASTEPVWPITSGTTVTSGTVTFTEAGAHDYNVDLATAEGWLWKATRLAGRYDFDADGQSYKRSQVYDHAMKMHAHYAARGAAWVPTDTGVVSPLSGPGTITAIPPDSIVYHDGERLVRGRRGGTAVDPSIL